MKYRYMRYWWLHLIVAILFGAVYYITKISIFKYIVYFMVFAYAMSLSMFGIMSIVLMLFAIIPKQNKHIKNRAWIIDILCLAGFSGAFFYVNAIWGKSIFLILALYLIFSYILHLLKYINFSFLLIPFYAIKSLSITSSIIISSVYYIYCSQSKIGQLIYMLFLIGGVYGGLIALYLVAMNSIIINKLRNGVAQNSTNPITIPYVVLNFSGKLQERILRRYIIAATQIMFRFKYLTFEPLFDKSGVEKGFSKLDEFKSVLTEALPAFNKRRMFAIFIEVRDIEKCDKNFQEWFLQNSSAYVAIVNSGSLDEDKHLRQQLHNCHGPSMLIDFEHDDEHLQGYELINGDILKINTLDPSNIITPVVETLSSSALPIFSSDRHLSPTHRSLIGDIAEKGLSPIADIYLRFRLSKSSVERYLCVIDGFELLVKFSAIILLADQLRINNPITEEDLKKLSTPSFGTWREVLQNILRNRPETEISSYLYKYWYGQLSDVHKTLVKTVSEKGIYKENNIPKNKIQWMSWVVGLRNITKGHGGVDEKLCAPIWHPFHEAMLEMIASGKDLFIDSNLEGIDGENKIHNMNGWVRGGIRGQNDSSNEEPYLNANIITKISTDIALFPFVLFKGNTCLIYNSFIKNSLNYIDYSTGKIIKVKFPSTDVNQLWRCKNLSELSLIEQIDEHQMMLKSISQYIKSGRSYLISGNCEEAIEAFKCVLEVDPANEKARQWLSVAYLRMGDSDNAYKYLTQDIRNS